MQFTVQTHILFLLHYYLQNSEQNIQWLLEQTLPFIWRDISERQVWGKFRRQDRNWLELSFSFWRKPIWMQFKYNFDVIRVFRHNKGRSWWTQCYFNWLCFNWRLFGGRSKVCRSCRRWVDQCKCWWGLWWGFIYRQFSTLKRVSKCDWDERLCPSVRK